MIIVFRSPGYVVQSTSFMNEVPNINRVIRLIKSAIDDLTLDLKGITVLTEAASGAYVVTPLIAALAGADQVYAVTRDSRFGAKEDVRAYTYRLADIMGVCDCISVSFENPKTISPECHLVTNLGFIRPIDAELIQSLPANAAVSLMWETWEYRDEDVDLEECRKSNVPILGTRETHPRLNIFRYIGLLVLKLLLQQQIEVFQSRILVIGSGHFGSEAELTLKANGADVLRLDPTEKWNPTDSALEAFLQLSDAVILVEHNVITNLLGEEQGIPLDWISKSSAEVIHICGSVDEAGIIEQGIRKTPDFPVKMGFMSYATDFVGPRPVIDLHTAGLKVGEALVRGMRRFGDREEAIDFALKNSPAMDWA